MNLELTLSLHHAEPWLLELLRTPDPKLNDLKDSQSDLEQSVPTKRLDLRQKLEEFRLKLMETLSSSVPASELAALKIQLMVMSQQIKDTSRKSVVYERRGTILDDQVSILNKKLESKNQEVLALQQKQQEASKIIMRTIQQKMMKALDLRLDAHSQKINLEVANLTLRIGKVGDLNKQASKAFRKSKRQLLRKSPSSLFDKPSNESEKRIVKFCVDLSRLLNSTICTAGEVDLEGLYERINSYLTDSYLHEEASAPEFMGVSNPQLHLEAKIHALTKENKNYKEEITNLKIENRDLQNIVAKAEHDVEHLRSQVNHSRIASSKMGLEIKKLKTMQTYGQINDQDYSKQFTMGEGPSNTSIMPFQGVTRKGPQRADSFGENVIGELEISEQGISTFAQITSTKLQSQQSVNYQYILDLFVKEQKESNMLKCRS